MFKGAGRGTRKANRTLPAGQLEQSSYPRSLRACGPLAHGYSSTPKEDRNTRLLGLGGFWVKKVHMETIKGKEPRFKELSYPIL